MKDLKSDEGDTLVIAARSRAERHAARMRDTKLFMWDWVSGGYNSCRAVDAAEALLKAQEMGEGRDGRITLVPRNIREATGGELSARDECWD